MVPSVRLAIVINVRGSRRDAKARISSEFRGARSSARRDCSELQDLIDPFAKLRDTRVNAGLIRRGTTDSPADDSGEDPSLVSRSLNNHRTAAVALRIEDDKLKHVLYARSYR